MTYEETIAAAKKEATSITDAHVDAAEARAVLDALNSAGLDGIPAACKALEIDKRSLMAIIRKHGLYPEWTWPRT